MSDEFAQWSSLAKLWHAESAAVSTADIEQHARRQRQTLLALAVAEALGFALVFMWGGYFFTTFAWNRLSELAELPLWLIHIAWPITGLTWFVFQAEHVAEALGVLLGRDVQGSRA